MELLHRHAERLALIGEIVREDLVSDRQIRVADGDGSAPDQRLEDEPGLHPVGRCVKPELRLGWILGVDAVDVGEERCGSVSDEFASTYAPDDGVAKRLTFDLYDLPLQITDDDAATGSDLGEDGRRRGWIVSVLGLCRQARSSRDGSLNVVGGLEVATDRTTYFNSESWPISDDYMGQQLVVSVWGARGGQGATTIAVVAAALSGAQFTGGESWAPEWMFGHPLTQSRPTLVVRDAGQLRKGADRSEVNIVVLRGPCLMALRSVSSLIQPGDHLVLVREPWRVISSAEVLSFLNQRIAVEIPFSERIARLVDAGLLGARLEELDEFTDLADWLDIIEVREPRSA